MSFFHDEVIALFERGCPLRGLVPVPALVLLIWAFAALTPDRALAGAINCSFIAVTPGNTAVTCTDGADVTPDGGLEIDLEDETVLLDGNDITPAPFDTEETNVTVNLGYSDEVGQGLYLETTDSDGVVILTDDMSTATINFAADGSIVAEYDGIQVGANSNFDGRGDVIINARGDITAGAYGEGIQVWRTEGNTDADVTITNEGTILAGGDGVRINADGTVTVTNDGSIGTAENRTGDIGVAIYGSGYGAAIVNNHSLLSIHSDGDGIRIEDKGSVNIDNDGGSIEAGQEGVAIARIDGPADIHNWGGSITGYWDGIDANGIEGTFVVHNSFGGSITGIHGDGIDLDDIDDNVTIFNLGGSIYGGDDGVKVTDVWSGNVSIQNSGGSITGDHGEGVYVVEVDGNVTVNNILFGDITGYWDGVQISNVEGRVTVSNSLGGSITGLYGDGIDLDDIDDNVTLNNLAGGIYGGDDGVKITDVWDGNVSIQNSGGSITGDGGKGVRVGEIDGNVTINNALLGSIYGYWDGIQIAEVEGRVTILNSFDGEIEGEEGDGIDISDVDDDVTIFNRFGGRITGEDDAIRIHDVWQGDVTIYNDGGTIRAWHGDAIRITDVDGSVYVENGEGSIRGAEHAISIEAEWAEISSEGLIRGEGSEEYPTIRLATDDGAIINNYAGGLIRGDAHSSTDLIVAASGGAVEINNSGDMFGRVDLSAAGSTEAPNVFNNMSALSWTFTGTSEFGDGLADVFNNVGTVHVTDPDDPEDADYTVFSGLEFFNNGAEGEHGGSGMIDLQDGFTGDVAKIRPTDGGELVFHGVEGRSFVSIDAFLAGPDDDRADLLVIEGEVTGRTQLNVANLNPDGAFYNPDGVKVVEAYSSSGDGGEFFLDGPVKAGFFDYGLFFEQNGTDDWYLRSDVNGDGEALASIQTGMTTLFHDSTGMWNQRTTELRDAFTGSVVATHGSASLPPTSGPGHGVWAVAFGGSQNRSATFTTLIDTYDTSYRQGTLGAMGGIDTRLDIGGDGVLLAGLTGGYVGSSMSFPSESSSGSMRGGSVGAYLTYLNGGLFTDFLVKADLLNLRHTADGATANTSGRAIGAIADVGYRMNGGEVFVEPMATLAYVNTTTGAFSLLGTDVSFPDGNSLLGRLGMRVGAGTVASATHRVETYVTASVWNEFLGGDTATIVGLGGDPVTVTNDGIGLYFEVGAGVEVASLTNGVSGFLRGDFQFGDTIRGGSGRGGVRVNW